MNHGSGHNSGHKSDRDSRCVAGTDQARGPTSLAARVATGLIGVYQRYISPFLGPRCRFHPTCSAYAGQAIGRFGVVRGTWLALCRIVRCQPLCDGGVDPVPEQFYWLRRNTSEPE